MPIDRTAMQNMSEAEARMLLARIKDNAEIVELKEDRDRLRSALESLHKRLRALAVDSGAVQTEDAVEDVRRAMEGMREVCEAAREWEQADYAFQTFGDDMDEHVELSDRLEAARVALRDAVGEFARQEIAARRLAAARKGE